MSVLLTLNMVISIVCMLVITTYIVMFKLENFYKPILGIWVLVLLTGHVLGVLATLIALVVILLKYKDLCNR